MISDCHVLRIKNYDIANGPGVRVSVWFAGCSHHCRGCHNPETWKWTQGKSLDSSLVNQILDLCEKPYISGLTLTGGDPMFIKNREGLLYLLEEFRRKFGDSKTVWMWTGYTLEELDNDLILDYIDTLIDGKYDEALKDVSLPYAGSSNQRVIHFVYQGLKKKEN